MKTDFRELKVEMRQRIMAGVWPLGTMLSNEVDLAEEFDCARATVNRAMRELAEEGLVDRKRKAGTRVRKVPRRQVSFGVPLVRAEIENSGARYRYALLRSEVSVVPDWLRAKMNLPEGVNVRRVQAMHYADGLPYQYEDRWLNLEYLSEAEGASFADTPASEWLVSQATFSDVEMSLSAQTADVDVARLLECDTGAALFRVERCVWQQGRPITFARLLYHQGFNLTTRY